MRFFLKCYRTDKLAGPILVNLDRVLWIERSSTRRGCSVVALETDDDDGLSEVFFNGRPEDVAAHVISVIGV